jgi:hypothetical protein
MDVNLLPNTERRALRMAEEQRDVTYPVIEYRGYYARIGLFTGLGELFYIRSANNASTAPNVAGVVVKSSKTEQVSLLLLYRPLEPEHQPFVATRLETEFFKADLT